ncbi:MAG TPA: hypothetical protein VML35_06305 [Gaiellaceae bacterium]|nr:hypothetical protein [Gaiellaceae bacterium]
MRSRLALIALAAALAGCGGDGDDDRRDAVSAYIRDANTALQGSATALVQAERALRDFSLDGAAAAESERELTSVLDTLASVRAALARLRPPAEARTLHADTLELVDTQVRLAGDLRDLAGHLPAAARVLRDAEAARAKLQGALESSGTGEEQAAATRAYAVEVERSLAAFRALEPPDILADWHTGQLNVLQMSVSLATDLADALEAKNEDEIRRVLSGFEKVSRNAVSTARAQVLAVREFNRRVEAQRVLVTKIAAEQRRLDRELG